MTDPPSFPLTKLDAARRQLEVAVQLWFYDRDPVSINTLGSAAYQLIADINRHRGKMPMLETPEGIAPFIKPERLKEALIMFNKAKVFTKHADRDPEGILEFRPEANAFTLWEASVKYQQLTGERVATFEAMRCWFLMKNPHLLQVPDEQKNSFEVATQNLGNLDKKSFYEAFSSHFHALP